MSNAERNKKAVLTYFEACGNGDLASFESTLNPNVVHYFLQPMHKPIFGSEHLTRYWLRFLRDYKPIWRVDHILATADEAVSEWSCDFLPKSDGGRKMFRGTEWYVMRNFRICEVRAYYQYDDQRDSELAKFPYAERGYLVKAE